MATTAGNRLTLDPMGKFSNAFFSETTNMIKAKLYMNVHWMVLYKPRWLPPQVIVLTQAYMGKYRNIFFFEAIALIEPKLCINHWKVFYKLHVIYVDRNSKMTTTAGHSFYIGPIGSFYYQVNDTGS